MTQRFDLAVNYSPSQHPEVRYIVMFEASQYHPHVNTGSIARDKFLAAHRCEAAQQATMVSLSSPISLQFASCRAGTYVVELWTQASLSSGTPQPAATVTGVLVGPGQSNSVSIP